LTNKLSKHQNFASIENPLKYLFTYYNVLQFCLAWIKWSFFEPSYREKLEFKFVILVLLDVFTSCSNSHRDNPDNSYWLKNSASLMAGNPSGIQRLGRSSFCGIPHNPFNDEDNLAPLVWKADAKVFILILALYFTMTNCIWWNYCNV